MSDDITPDEEHFADELIARMGRVASEVLRRMFAEAGLMESPDAWVATLITIDVLGTMMAKSGELVTKSGYLSGYGKDVTEDFAISTLMSAMLGLKQLAESMIPPRGAT